MINRRALIGLSICSSLAACTSIEDRKVAQGSFEYLQEEQIQPLKLPENFDQPQYKDDYKIVDVSSSMPEGSQLDVRSPVLVRAIPDGARVEEGMGRSQIWIDKVYESEDLSALVWQSVSGYLSEQNIGIAEQSDTHIVTDWIVPSEHPNYWLWAEVGTNKSVRYRYDLEMKTHGRSGLFKVALVDYVENNNNQVADLLGNQEQDRVEAGVMNRTLSFYDYQLRRLTNDSGDGDFLSKMLIDLGFDRDGWPALLVEIEPNRMWSNLPALFSYFRFETLDQDRSANTYNVRYEKPEQSMWDSIWDDAVPELPLPPGEYQFKVSESNDMTTISIFDKDGNALSPALMSSLFEPMRRALSLTDQ